MTRPVKTAVIVLAVAAVSGCKACSRSSAPPPSIKPSIHASGAVRLLPELPMDNSPDFALDDLDLPKGYDVDAVSIDTTIVRHEKDPEIEIVSRAVHPDMFLKPDCRYAQDAGAFYPNIKRGAYFASRPDGFVLVCQKLDFDGEILETTVARTIHWRDSEVQCQVVFDRGYTERRDRQDVLVHPHYDRGDPSSARIVDALAICDSVKIYEYWSYFRLKSIILDILYDYVEQRANARP